MLTQRIIRSAGQAQLAPLSTEYSGALPVGQASYEIPSSNVIYLALNGDDANSGSLSSPKATLQAAITAVPSGGTVVVRAGVYNQAYTGDMTKTITLQNYPNEAVWFDGTVQVSNWTNNDDGTWYCVQPATFTHGADFSGSGDPTRWIDGQTRERAFWPEMVFIDDIEQYHTEGTPSAGTFKVDEDTGRIYIGTNPSGKDVRVTRYGRLIVVKAPNCRLLGFGVRRYASNMLSNGAITAVTASTGTLQENLHFVDFPIQANSCSGDNATIRYCTFKNIGMMASSCNLGSDSKYVNNYLENINTRLFKGPTPAGVKFARWTNGLVAHNYVKNVQRVYGIWMDVFNYNCIMLNNYIENSGGGVFYEISWNGLMVNNRTVNMTNGGNSASYWVYDCRDTELWLNEADRGTSYDVWIAGDSREGATPAEQPDGVGDIRTVDAVVNNNMFSNTVPQSGTWRIMVEAVGLSRDCSSYLKRLAGNVVSSTSSASGTSSISRYLTIERSDGIVVTRTTNDDAIAQWGSEKIGNNLFTSTQTPASTNVITPAVIASYAEPLPDYIASLVNLPAGTKAIGPVLPRPIARIPSY